MIQVPIGCSMSFCFARRHQAFANWDSFVAFFFYVMITVVKSMEKIRLQLAKPIAWFTWLSMCPGTHESEFMLMMAFVLLQLNQW